MTSESKRRDITNPSEPLHEKDEFHRARGREKVVSRRSPAEDPALVRRRAGLQRQAALRRMGSCAGFLGIRMAKVVGLFIVLVLLAITPEPTRAQSQSGEETPVTSQGGISYSTALPTGEFDEALGRTSQGVDLYLGVKAGSLPLYLGVDFDLGRYGSEKRTVNVLGVDGTFQTQSFLYQPHLSARYQPATGKLRPFVEGLVGANVLTTSTTWTDFGTTVEVPQDVDETSVAFSTGVGLGLDIRIARVKPLGILGLTGSLHYIYGSEANVPVAEGVAVEEGQVSTVSTNTSVLQPEVGLYFEF